MPPTEGMAAGFWPRAVAWCVDALIVGALSCLLSSSWTRGDMNALGMRWRGLGTTLGNALRSSVARGEDAVTFMAAMLVDGSPLRIGISEVIDAIRAAALPPLIAFVLIGLHYWPLQESAARGATIGKQLLGLRSASTSGEHLSPMPALKRHLAGTLSWLTLNIGHLFAARAPMHQALHDRIAHTQVLWREDALRRLPAWGRVLLVLVVLLPVVLAISAAMSLAGAMQAARGF